MPTRMVVAVTAWGGAFAADAGPAPDRTAMALRSRAPTAGVTRLFRILILRRKSSHRRPRRPTQ
jgi:hypothetical protein